MHRQRNKRVKTERKHTQLLVHYVCLCKYHIIFNILYNNLQTLRHTNIKRKKKHKHARKK